MLMHKRKANQISLFDDATMFGSTPLDPANEWVKLSKLIPWDVAEEEYAKNFLSPTGQPACSARMALGSLIIKERYGSSDEDVVGEIRMNPYLQFFLGMHTFTHHAPFDASMLTRFRKRFSPEMIARINDIVIERSRADGSHPDQEETCAGKQENAPLPDISNNQTGSEPDASCETQDAEACTGSDQPSESSPDSVNSGTLILDATCAPQHIRFPTDTSLLNEARESLEGFIDLLHAAALTNGKKPRTYREKAHRDYIRFVKNRKKSAKLIRKAIGRQLGYLQRDILHVLKIEEDNASAFSGVLTKAQTEKLAVCILLFLQQQKMFESGSHSIPNRIVSLCQHWVRPILRGKQTADVEFGAKIEASLVGGYARIEKLSWDPFNEGGTLIGSVEAFRRDYGHYPKKVLVDKIFRTRENMRYCKEHGIHMNGPKLGRRPDDPALYRQQLRDEWLESGERGAIERDFGVAKTRYSLDSIFMKLKHTSEVAIHVCFLTRNLWRKLRLLLCLLFSDAHRTICADLTVHFLWIECVP